MAIGNRGIGWSQEENLLWEVSRQLDRMNSILCPCPITTTTSTTIVPTTTTTTTIPLVNTNNLFQECPQPCGSTCGPFLFYYDVWMTQECIDTFPTIGCAIWNNEEGTNPFNDGTYNLGNGDCIVITGGIITDILTY
jgi:hypothetical protein